MESWKKQYGHLIAKTVRLEKAKRMFSIHSVTKSPWKDYWKKEIQILEDEEKNKINRWKKYGARL